MVKIIALTKESFLLHTHMKKKKRKKKRESFANVTALNFDCATLSCIWVKLACFSFFFFHCT